MTCQVLHDQTLAHLSILIHTPFSLCFVLSSHMALFPLHTLSAFHMLSPIPGMFSLSSVCSWLLSFWVSVHIFFSSVQPFLNTCVLTFPASSPQCLSHYPVLFSLKHVSPREIIFQFVHLCTCLSLSTYIPAPKIAGALYSSPSSPGT